MSKPTACPECLRRANLLAQLAPYIERATVDSGGDAPALRELLGLPNEFLAERVAPQVAATILRTIDAPTDDRLIAEARTSECWSVCCHQERYPVALGQGDAPAALFGRGDSLLLRRLRPDHTVTIVGARRATAYGREVARELGRDLADAGLAVVSGLAFGIEGCAHRGALEGGLTVAVLGCGADVAYPASHRSLWRRIGENGLVLSELPPGTDAWRWSFPARNRIMAALSEMTVVVEAAERSGSLVTADFAAELGYDLGAVPGPVGSRASAGPNNLLAAGATVVRDAQDVLDAMLGPGTRIVPPKDRDSLRHTAGELIAEDRVPSDVLEDLIDTYCPKEDAPCD